MTAATTDLLISGAPVHTSTTDVDGATKDHGCGAVTAVTAGMVSVDWLDTTYGDGTDFPIGHWSVTLTPCPADCPQRAQGR